MSEEPWRALFEPAFGPLDLSAAGRVDHQDGKTLAGSGGIGPPIYVAIESATTLGSGASIVGNIYVREPTGALRPLTGTELIELHERHPAFIRNWRLPR